MPRDKSSLALMPSVLDRLIDPDSLGTSDRPWYGVDQMARAVRRDLAALLNTRQTHEGLCDAYPECQRSLLAFGLPDLPSLKPYTENQRAEIRRRIEKVICLFEPRLRDVQVTAVDSPHDLRRMVHYLVEARLHVAQAPEIAFEVVLELTTGQYDVQTRGS